MKKKVIFMGSYLYGYEKEIINELNKNYNTLYIDMIPNLLTFIFNKLLQIFYKKELLYERLLNKKILKQIYKIKEKEADFLIVIGWGLLQKKTLEKISTQININRKILYLWDDVSKLKNLKEYADYFDNIYSFDKEDCKKYNYKYLPTFYSKGLENKKIIKIKYLMSFIGQYNENRNKILKDLQKIVEKKNKQIYISQYMNWLFFILKKIKKEKIFLKDIVFFKISRKKYNNILSKSYIILDLISNNQSGVTQRALDAIILEKKIITNNENIKNYSFYNENNIFIIPKDIRSLEEKIEKFINKEYIKIPFEVIKEYSIESWVKKLLG